jgi:hypothetical protein
MLGPVTGSLRAFDAGSHTRPLFDEAKKLGVGFYLGFNTPELNTGMQEPSHHRMFHNFLTMQAGADQNATRVAAAAKAGLEEGCMMMGGSRVIAPSAEIVAVTRTLGDELLAYEIDFDATRPYKQEKETAGSESARVTLSLFLRELCAPRG